MPFQKGHKLAPGGARPNSGPKPTARTEFRALLVEHCPDVLALMWGIINDPLADIAERGRNMRWWVNQVVGKAPETIKVEGQVNILAAVIDAAKVAEVQRLAREHAVKPAELEAPKKPKK